MNRCVCVCVCVCVWGGGGGGGGSDEQGAMHKEQFCKSILYQLSKLKHCVSGRIEHSAICVMLYAHLVACYRQIFYNTESSHICFIQFFAV